MRSADKWRSTRWSLSASDCWSRPNGCCLSLTETRHSFGWVIDCAMWADWRLASCAQLWWRRSARPCTWSRPAWWCLWWRPSAWVCWWWPVGCSPSAGAAVELSTLSCRFVFRFYEWVVSAWDQSVAAETLPSELWSALMTPSGSPRSPRPSSPSCRPSTSTFWWPAGEDQKFLCRLSMPKASTPSYSTSTEPEGSNRCSSWDSSRCGLKRSRYSSSCASMCAISSDPYLYWKASACRASNALWQRSAAVVAPLRLQINYFHCFERCKDSVGFYN